MAAQTILVIDDEEKIRQVLCSYLEHSGYQVIQAANGQSAMAMFLNQHPNLVVLDLMLPDLSGQEVCRAMRARSAVPILMLTARVDEASLLDGFALGADDYLTKPFSPKELVVRVQALLRRAHSHQPYQHQDHKIYSPDSVLELDTLGKTLSKSGSPIKLTATEYRLMELFLTTPGRVYSRENLVNHALGGDFDGSDRTIDAHIKNLRLKLEDDAREPRYLETVHGMGYRMAPL